MNLHLIIFGAWVNLERTCVLLLYCFIFLFSCLDVRRQDFTHIYSIITTDQVGKCRSWYPQKLSANIKSALLIQDFWTRCNKQIQNYVDTNNLNAYPQSAYRKYYSTETAVVRVTNDILRAVDNHHHVILVLLDLSAAFDTLDHAILLQRFQERFGITGNALRWMTSYFHERQQCVVINGTRFDWKQVLWGAPQGSVFGPMAFSFYSAPVEDIIMSHGLECMIYADDTQIYFSFNDLEMDTAVSRIEKCVSDIRSWMITNQLMLNDSKTEILHLTLRFTPAPQLSSLRVGGAEVAPSTSARDLGVVIDEHATMSQHVSSVCSSASFALYNIDKLRTYLNQASTKMLVRTFVSSRLDSCNSLLYGLPQNELERLQRVQNAAARLVSGVKGRVHMTPVLRKLYWLPISKRVMFKILLLTFKAINGLAPQYIVDLLTTYSPHCLKPSRRQPMVIAHFQPRHQSCWINVLRTFVQSNHLSASSHCWRHVSLETSLICILLLASLNVHFDKRMICFLSDLL